MLKPDRPAIHRAHARNRIEECATRIGRGHQVPTSLRETFDQWRGPVCTRVGDAHGDTAVDCRATHARQCSGVASSRWDRGPDLSPSTPVDSSMRGNCWWWMNSPTATQKRGLARLTD